jgi:hypothetical protein
MTTATEQAETQQLLDGELAAFVDACTTPERKAEVLVKLGFYDVELKKQEALLANVDDELAQQAAEEWFAQGDEDLKRALWNSRAGSVEIPLRKVAPVPEPELALAKMLEEQTSDSAKAHFLHKVSSYTTEMHNMITGLQGQPDDRVEAVVHAWLTCDPGDMQLKKNILDAEMPPSGKRMYGQGVQTQTSDPVTEYAGNASTHAGRKLGGSETNSDGAIKRTIPKGPAGEGSGRRVGTARAMPHQEDGETPHPGSGTAGPDGGSANVQPETVIRRKGATGGLGSVAGAEHASGVPTVANDGTHKASQWGKGKKKVGKSADQYDDDDEDDAEAQKAEFVTGLLKIAPDEMIAAILELDEDDQEVAAGVAANHAADLLAWTDQLSENGLAKRDLDASVAEWLAEDPDQAQLKIWVAEALATAEEIPLELAKAIMDWTPQPRVSVRREAKAA